MSDSQPTPYEHYRPTNGTLDGGVYRVVGVADADETVALLRVVDADGSRVHSGELEHVDQSALESSFEPVDDPDDGRLKRILTRGAFGMMLVGVAVDLVANVPGMELLAIGGFLLYVAVVAAGWLGYL